ncbi:MAG: sodium-independent anion transporter, partial [Oscillospiraceae bacterium]|nr:sodium-independent anion transporter [Oscillospiraceae bacterium]
LADAGHELVSPLKHTKLVYLAGPMFFGTQDKLTDCLSQLENSKAIVFSMRGVPTIDDSAIAELEEIFDTYTKNGVNILFSGVQSRVRGTLERAGFIEKVGEDRIFWDAVQALAYLDEQAA